MQLFKLWFYLIYVNSPFNTPGSSLIPNISRVKKQSRFINYLYCIEREGAPEHGFNIGLDSVQWYSQERVYRARLLRPNCWTGLYLTLTFIKIEILDVTQF